MKKIIGIVLCITLVATLFGGCYFSLKPSGAKDDAPTYEYVTSDGRVSYSVKVSSSMKRLSVTRKEKNTSGSFGGSTAKRSVSISSDCGQVLSFALKAAVADGSLKQNASNDELFEVIYQLSNNEIGYVWWDGSSSVFTYEKNDGTKKSIYVY